MSRRRKKEEEKKVKFNLSIEKQIIDELKQKEEIPSRIIEDLVRKYLKEREKDGEKG